MGSLWKGLIPLLPPCLVHSPGQLMHRLCPTLTLSVVPPYIPRAWGPVLELALIWPWPPTPPTPSPPTLTSPWSMHGTHFCPRRHSQLATCPIRRAGEIPHIRIWHAGFYQAVVAWNNRQHFQNKTNNGVLLFGCLLSLPLVWLVCWMHLCLRLFVFLSSEVGGWYLLHCSWLCFTFMLPISWFSLSLAVAVLFFFFLVLPEFSYFHFGLIHFAQIVSSQQVKSHFCYRSILYYFNKRSVLVHPTYTQR